MDHLSFDNGPLTFAIAMAVGVVAQGLARHVRLPGIVLLLTTGVLLGPDAADIVRPESMGSGLGAVVGFSVAIILFEGGLNLRLDVLRAQATPIRRLVTVGAVLTGSLAALVAKLIMGWDWQLAILFGTLVIVTGPTVITPLLRRIRVRHNISTILEAEGIFIDAVGATIAVVALEIVIADQRLDLGFVGVLTRIGLGGAIGIAGGLILGLLLRWRKVVPHGLENVLALSFAVLLFEGSNALVHESGITATIMAGLVLGNMRTHALEEIIEFKEQLTALLIATLFVLLAADVRLADVQALGWEGVATVAALMLVVRPIVVFASTYKTDLTVNEKLFLSWLAPRGIVAAAVASLFALKLAAVGIPGGVQLKAMVFLVIASTVFVQGLSGGLVAKLLGVRQAGRTGYVFLGANRLAQVVAGILDEARVRVTLVDSNEDACRSAAANGFEVVHGNALEVETLREAGVDTAAVCVGLSPNESINFLFARRILDESPHPAVQVALETAESGVTEDMVRHHEVGVLFAGERHLSFWLDLATRGYITRERWRFARPSLEGGLGLRGIPIDMLLPTVLYRGDKVSLIQDEDRLRTDDAVEFIINPGKLEDAQHWLVESGWVRLDQYCDDSRSETA